MNPKLLILLLSLPFIASAQTKQIVKEDRENSRVEKYYVLTDDEEIKEGEYKAYGLFQDNLLRDGFYKGNLKDSLWHVYSYGNKVLLEGNYKADMRIGIWTAYDLQGKLQVQYNYTDKKLLAFMPIAGDSTQMYRLINGTDTTAAMLERLPICLDGAASFKNTIARVVRYPKEAREALKTGMVIISFTIGTNGTVSNYRIVKRLGYGLDESALKAVKYANGEWLPAIFNGKPVTIEYDVPVVFSLSY
jgi:TonB family protein